MLLRSLVASLLVAYPLGAFQSNPPRDFESERAQANKLFTEGRALDALPLYKDLVRRDPQNPAFAERHAAG